MTQPAPLLSSCVANLPPGLKITPISSADSSPSLSGPIPVPLALAWPWRGCAGGHEGRAGRALSNMGRVSMAGPGTQPCCSTAVAAPWGRDKDTELVCLSLLALEPSTPLALAVPPQHPLHSSQGLQGLEQAPSGVGATACCPPSTRYTRAGSGGGGQSGDEEPSTGLMARTAGPQGAVNAPC